MPDQEEVQARAQAPYPAAPIPFIYFNGFELNGTLSDFGLMLLYDGQPQAKTALSFTTAKTLLVQLKGAIDAFEKATKQSLLIMDDVGRAYEEAKK